MDTLPTELITGILEYLDQTDLRASAAVSRALYGSAWRAGLYIHRNVQWRGMDRCADELTVLSEVVRHALRKDLRLSFTLTFSSWDSAGHEIYDNLLSPSAHAILALVTSALSILVYLSVNVTENFVPMVTAALCRPAPNIAVLELHVDLLFEEQLPKHQDCPGMAVEQIPANLFMGCAPKLRRLVLKDILLGCNAFASFSRVDSVALDYAEVFPNIQFAHHFPRLRALHLAFSTELYAPPPRSFNLDGVRLRRLTLGSHDSPDLMPAIMRSTNIFDIPNIQLIGDNVQWANPLWTRKGDGPISICLQRAIPPAYVDISMIVVPGHRGWRRAFDLLEWHTSQRLPISELPALGERLTYLRMDNTHIASLLEDAEISFDSLAQLRVDFRAQARHPAIVWPPDWLHACRTFSFDKEDKSAPAFSRPSYRTVACGALRKLTLFAINAGLSAASQEVAFLGRALSQCARPKLERASLELVGIELNVPVAQELLEQTFSATNWHEFAGGDSARCRDAGLWDDEP
ncbi:hypothetical protein AURDEDRAFT_163699 [Auricularia subglabra TFB-10046 SS5]|nr:hypothetical protein AURDEDRAFT_163699 [Auricularia subglabra TFB-10046 SS5]